MHFHKWGKWEQVSNEELAISKDGKVIAKLKIYVQKKVCSICGFIQYHKQTLKTTVDEMYQ
jgi:hypothetical protein